MKQRPSFPARLDTTLAKNRPNTVGKPVAATPAAKTVAPTAPVAGSAHKKAAPLPGAPQSHGMDSSAVRNRMVQKLAAGGVTDAQVLTAMGTIERHRFVDSALVNQAYEDTSLPIGLGQTISKPGVVSRMLELLLQGQLGNPGKLGRVLEIGTGCGYQAAVLSLLATEVYSIERLRGLHDKARDNLRPLRLANLHLLFGDGMVGYAKGAPYAGIIAAAGGEAVPQAWVDQLAVGGRLVAPVVTAGAPGAQALLVLDKTAQGVRQTLLEAVHFVPLKSGVA
ncbi:MAG: protein-L-isoaspartate(D-aspartate) O-methyltransferase [Burkholderiales bacterium]|nr:protein-L-isoaspartate(D-aspartate) O-methyltransferase [Burkholderiales bacterium]